MREYRGKSIDNGDWVYGYFLVQPTTLGDKTHIIYDGEYEHAVDPDTAGQHTELQDKNRRQIFEGDILLIRRPGRDEQTHYGDNIPLGSYTEPMEPVVTEEIVSVIFANGWFGYVQTADKPHYTVDDFEAIPLSWALNESTASNEDELKELFSGNWGPRIIEGWEDDKDYLFEMYKVSTIEELIKYVGVEVIGNRWDHPHLLGEDSK